MDYQQKPEKTMKDITTVFVHIVRVCVYVCVCACVCVGGEERHLGGDAMHNSTSPVR